MIMHSRRKILAHALLLIFCSALFWHTVNLRRETFGQLDGPGDGGWRSLTRLSQTFADNWYSEGIWRLRLSLVNSPYSVELRSWRDVYLSYPPGFVLPIYLLSELRQSPPTAELVMQYSLFNHWAVSAAAASVVFFLSIELGASLALAFLLGLGASAQMLYLLGPFFWYQHTWFADIASPLLFLLIVMVDCLAFYLQKRISGLLYFLLALAIFTDWLNLVLLAFLLLFRAFESHSFWEKDFLNRKRLLYFFACGGPLVLYFAWQTLQFNVPAILLERISTRGSFDFANLSGNFFQDLRIQYGVIGFYSIGTTAVMVAYGFFYYLRRGWKRREEWLALRFSALVLFPILAHMFLLQSHYGQHPYNGLKFSLIVSLLPFFILPLLFLKWARVSRWYVFPLLCLALINTYFSHRNWGSAKDGMVSATPQQERICRFLSENSRYEDVMFSPDFMISGPELYSNKQMLQFPYMANGCRKTVYGASLPAEINPYFPEFKRNFMGTDIFWKPPENVMVGLIFLQEPSEVWKKFLSEKRAVREKADIPFFRIPIQRLGIQL